MEKVTIERQIAWLRKMKDVFVSHGFDNAPEHDAVVATLVAAQTNLLPELPERWRIVNLQFFPGENSDKHTSPTHWYAEITRGLLHSDGVHLMILPGTGDAPRAAVSAAIAKIPEGK